MNISNNLKLPIYLTCYPEVVPVYSTCIRQLNPKKYSTPYEHGVTADMHQHSFTRDSLMFYDFSPVISYRYTLEHFREYGVYTFVRWILTDKGGVRLHYATDGVRTTGYDLFADSILKELGHVDHPFMEI